MAKHIFAMIAPRPYDGPDGHVLMDHYFLYFDSGSFHLAIASLHNTMRSYEKMYD